MTRTVLIAVIGLVLAIAPAQAADAKAEIDFVTRASNRNLAAMGEARLAPGKTRDPRITTLAQRLLQEHGAAQDALRVASVGSGATVTTIPDRDHQARLTALEGMSGADFDKTFLADQAEIHSNALTLYADYMLLGDNEKLKALAIRMIPIAQAQFKDIQALSGE